MRKYLPWNSSSSTMTQTFEEVDIGLRKEFPYGSVIRIAEAKSGLEEELVKLITLLMYLTVVKHHDVGIAHSLQDNTLFNKEVQLRFKCILQVMLYTF